jgi:hypothetical protein
MLSAQRAVSLAAAAALLLTLAGCSLGGSGEPGATDTDPGSSAGTDSGTDSGASGSSCIEDRTWVLDTDDLAAQLATQLSSGGLTVSDSTAEGRQSIEFSSDGTASSSVDVTYTLSVDSGDGIVITVVQTHSGEPHGQWEWVGDSTTLTFSGWDNAGYSVQNTVLVNGVAGDFPISIPSDTLGDTDMETTCSGNTLSTHVATSPFTQHWNAEG